ncbi:MAG: hypothetical protein JRJ00_14680 [Deltaproteobacteria bacterium]|nr:hypothetical protein [Deltaproteobacteria bacterium]
MDTTEYIAVCQKRLEQIEGILRQMEADGISKDVSVWGVLEEKYLFWTARLEACGQTDPGNGHSFNASEINMN